jgi:hypothetical protein
LAMIEAELFEYLQENLYPDLVKSEGIYDSFDCISQQAGHYIELKCRHTHYPTLLDRGDEVSQAHNAER